MLLFVFMFFFLGGGGFGGYRRAWDHKPQSPTLCPCRLPLPLLSVVSLLAFVVPPLTVRVSSPPVSRLLVVIKWKHRKVSPPSSRETYKTKADRRKTNKKKNEFSFFSFFFCCECLHLFLFCFIAYCNLFCVSSDSYTFLSITCMLLYIYAIVAVVTMTVCGFRPDFTIRSVTQRTGKTRKKK